VQTLLDRLLDRPLPVFKATAQTGMMVALYPDRSIAERLALTGGEAPEELHITLAYLGKADDVDQEIIDALPNIVRQFTRYSIGPLEGTIQGIGRFAASDSSSGKDPFYASVDIPRLPDFRMSLISSLASAGVEVNREHGFTPHMTLKYLASDEPNPIERLEPIDVSFDSVWLCIGGKRQEFKLDPATALDSGIIKTAATAGRQKRDDKGRWIGRERHGSVSSPGARHSEHYATDKSDKQLLSTYREVTVYLANATKTIPRSDEGRQRREHAIRAHNRSLKVVKDELTRRGLMTRDGKLTNRGRQHGIMKWLTS
jgi:2'-5' RNA ligase